MNMKKDKILKELQKTKSSLRFPKYINFEINDDCLNVHIEGNGVVKNMQENSSAFEGWIVCIKAWMNINKVKLNWSAPDEIYHKDEKEKNRQKKHYNRFLMRVIFFKDNYSWVEVDKSKEGILNESRSAFPTFVLNYPKSESKEKVSESETKNQKERELELKLVKKIKGDVVNHQLPVGVFKNTVSTETTFAPRSASQIDLWSLEKNALSIYELKCKSNNEVGIISELMYYANIMNLFVNGMIKYPDELKKSKTNFRNEKELYDAICKKQIKELNAVFLNYTFHPLIEFKKSKVLEILNENKSKIKFNQEIVTDYL